MLHKNSIVGDQHIVHNWEYADAAARAAATGFVTADLNKLALDVDTKSLYLLATVSPPTWTAMGGAAIGDALKAAPLSQFAATTSAQLAGVISDETGSGDLVFATSPTLVTPVLGTPTSGDLSNCTFPVATGAEVNTGTNNTKISSPKALADSSFLRPLHLLITQTSGTYVLSAAESKATSIRVAATLVGNLTIQCPQLMQPVVVHNQCAGSYTVNITGATGSGVIVPQSSQSLVIGNGTDFTFVSNSMAASLLTNNSWTYAQRGTVLTLGYSATVTPDFNLSNNFALSLTGNVTLANPTNIAAGQSGTIFILQDATGSRLLSGIGTYFKIEGGITPTLTTTANAVDALDYVVYTSTHIQYHIRKDIK